MRFHERAARGRGRRIASAAFALVAVCVVGLGAASANGLVGVRAHGAAIATSDPVARPAIVRTVAQATASHLENSAETAKLTFDLTVAADAGPVAATSFILANPDRVIVDLPQVDFTIDPVDMKAGRHARRAGLIGAYRFGLLAPGRSRIVIDLDAPARIVAATIQKAGRASRLVVELARTDRAAFQTAARERAPEATPVATPIRPSLPTKATIVLDAGHGGPDTGAIVNGIIEKDVTLAFAKALAAKLEASGGFNVVMTRATDVFIPLSERVHLARGAEAALMISIHADTLPETSDVSGATVYTVSDKASDAYAAKVAAKENDADASVGIDGQADTADVNDILFDLTRQETRAYSHVFARTLVNYWKVAGRLNKNPQRSAGFVVLKAPDVPSVLLELGYLSSPTDAASLTSDDWRDKATGRMAESIVAYFADRQGHAKARAGVPMPLVKAENATPAAR